MAWLDALLAFAITMMVLSTMVSAVVEATHGLLNQRAKGLERLIEHMFDKIIAPRLCGQLPADLTGSRFVKQMTDKRWMPIETNAPKWKKTYYKFFNKWRKTDKAQKLSTLEFIERLAESPVATALLARSSKIGDKGEEALGVFLEDMASKFEDFGDSASTYFARRARANSILVGFVIVFSINFSAVDVFQTLIQSEAVREALIEQGEDIARSLDEQMASTAEARQQGLSISANVELELLISDVDVALQALGDGDRAGLSNAELAEFVDGRITLILARLRRTAALLKDSSVGQLVTDQQTAIEVVLAEWKSLSISDLTATQVQTRGRLQIEGAKIRLASLKDKLDASINVSEFDQDKVAQSVKDGMRTLQEAQLPIGWQHAPWQSEVLNLPTGETASSTMKFWQWLGFGPFVKWAASVFLAGLLVGLGGPFWFDTYRRLAALSSVAKSFQSQVKQEGQEPPPPDMPKEKRADRFVNIFNTARAASDFAKAAGRQPLTNDGISIQMGHIR